MKKLFTLLLFISIAALSFDISAEDSPDWTGTDTDGNTIHLYELLDDRGMYVTWDAFFVG